MQKFYNMMGIANDVGQGELPTDELQPQDLDGAVEEENAGEEEQKVNELQNDGDEDE